MSARARVSVVHRSSLNESAQHRAYTASQSRRVAGIVLIALPLILVCGALFIVTPVGSWEYTRNPMRQDIWRSAYAHAVGLLILSLVALRYVDDARLGEGWRQLVRRGIPLSALIIPFAMFASVLSPEAREPGFVINLVYAGAALLAVSLVTLGVGLVRASVGTYPVPVQFEADEPVPRARAVALPSRGWQERVETV
jgi:hypothetical protein